MLFTAQVSLAADSLYIVKNVQVSGNGATQDEIIFREIPFTAGDTLLLKDTSALAVQAERNLVNTSLFHFANIVFGEDGQVMVNVTERWYIWPVPFFNIEERNFNVWFRDMSLEKVTYGLYVYHENFRGRKEYLKILLKTGYNQTYGVSFSKPYIDKKKNWGLGAAVGFEASHAVSGSVVNHEPVTIKLPDEYAFSGIFSQIAVTRRVGIYQQHKASVFFESTHFADSVLRANPLYAPGSSWSRFSMNYQYRFDHRDVKNYPLTGWYADAELNAGALVGTSERNDQQLYLKSTSRKYFKINRRFYFATGATFYVSLKEGNNFASAGFLGYGNDFVRGFQYRVIPVRHYLIHRSNVKCNLIPQRIIKLPLIKTTKFNRVPFSMFVNVFYDQGWSERGAFSAGNNLAGQRLSGYGIGLDLVTYYDKVIRIEFTMNRFREKGLFLHFTAPV